MSSSALLETGKPMYSVSLTLPVSATWTNLLQMTVVWDWSLSAHCTQDPCCEAFNF